MRAQDTAVNIASALEVINLKLRRRSHPPAAAAPQLQVQLQRSLHIHSELWKLCSDKRVNEKKFLLLLVVNTKSKYMLLVYYFRISLFVNCRISTDGYF